MAFDFNTGNTGTSSTQRVYWWIFHHQQDRQQQQRDALLRRTERAMRIRRYILREAIRSELEEALATLDTLGVDCALL